MEKETGNGRDLKRMEELGERIDEEEAVKKVKLLNELGKELDSLEQINFSSEKTMYPIKERIKEYFSSLPNREEEIFKDTLPSPFFVCATGEGGIARFKIGEREVIFLVPEEDADMKIGDRGFSFKTALEFAGYQAQDTYFARITTGLLWDIRNEELVHPADIQLVWKIAEFKDVEVTDGKYVWDLNRRPKLRVIK